MTPAPTPTLMPMLASIFDSLFGLKRLSFSDGDATLGWRTPLPVWLWVTIIILAALFAGWTYNRLLGRRAARIALAALRTSLIVFIAALIAGPMLVVEDHNVEEDWLLVLVDRSASMNIRDVVDETGNRAMSRDAALRDALASKLNLFSNEKLGKNRRIIWLGFDRFSREIPFPGSDPTTHSSTSTKPDQAVAAVMLPFQQAMQVVKRWVPASQPPPDLNTPSNEVLNYLVTLPDADGEATSIRTAIEQSLQRAIGRPISGIVLFTDGRSPQTTGAELVSRLKRQGISVFPVPLGSQQTPLNLAVGRVDVPERAFVNDTIPVRVSVDRLPLDANIDPARVKVRLIDKTTGRTLDEKPVGDNLDNVVRLSTASRAAGRQNWQIVVDYDEPAGAPLKDRELVKDDNVEDVTIELVDRPIRVLYVEGYPRWEYRYLKTLIVREKTIDASIMLVSADSSFAQEGNSPITRLPSTAKELEPYDVIIIGDVPSNYFSVEQLTLLRDHVSARGAGVIWIGGDYFMPRSYDNTPLADLMPMRDPAVVERIDPAFGPIGIQPEPLAQTLNVLRLRTDTKSTGDTDAEPWPKELPAFLWAQDVGRLKPVAGVLATSNALGQRTMPMVIRLLYGSGQSVYMASDETWRWRFGRGEHYFQQYWIQLVRMLGRQRLQQRDEPAYLAVSNRRVQLNQTVKLTLTLKDALLLQNDHKRISVGVSKVDEPGRILERVDLLPVEGSYPAGADPQLAREYTAVWQASTAGELVLRVIQPGLDDLDLTELMEVTHPDDERRQVAADHPRLTTLAKETGGRVIELSDLDQLESAVPSRAVRTENDIREPLWDSPLSLLLVVLLITFEWIGRKVLRLV